MNYGKIAAILALLILLLAVARSLIRRDQDKSSPINFDDFLLGDDGRPSKAAAVMYVSLGVTSWCIVYMTLQDKLTDVMFGAYLAAWVAPTVTRIFKGNPGDPQPPAAGPTTTVQAAGDVTVRP